MLGYIAGIHWLISQLFGVNYAFKWEVIFYGSMGFKSNSAINLYINI